MRQEDVTLSDQESEICSVAATLVRSKGFQLWYDKDMKRYCAERDGWDFTAHDALSLLGLVSMFEARHPTSWREYWWREGVPDRMPDPPETPRSYSSQRQK